MPRPNPPRDIYAEEYLAQRIQMERERRGWSYEGLAKRMTDAGCPINQSALYKVEQGQPRRRITVDELVAMARVFETSVEDLLVDPKLLALREVVPLLAEWRDLKSRRYRVLEEIRTRQAEIEEEVRQMAADAPEVIETIRSYWEADAEEVAWTDEDVEIFGKTKDELTDAWARSNASQFLPREPKG